MSYESSTLLTVSSLGVVWAATVMDHTVIDEINILEATMRAMHQSVEEVTKKIEGMCHVAIDGNRVPEPLRTSDKCSAEAVEFTLPMIMASHACFHRQVVKGDGKVHSIAAASILAKVTRDRLMVRYPGLLASSL